jgi:PAS domain S-box-containing protein
VFDDEGKIKLVNASAEKLFGYTRLELIGQNVEVLIPDRLVNAHKLLRDSYLADPQTRAMGQGRDLSARRKDGSEFAVEIGLNALSREGRHVVLATVMDISERKKATEQQRLMINEMRHRTQNLFAVVHAVAARGLDERQNVTEAKATILSRIEALARAHAMLADAAWEGAPLDQIVRQTLAALSAVATSLSLHQRRSSLPLLFTSSRQTLPSMARCPSRPAASLWRARSTGKRLKRCSHFDGRRAEVRPLQRSYGGVSGAPSSSMPPRDLASTPQWTTRRLVSNTNLLSP